MSDRERPNDLRYRETHEWIRVDDAGIGTVGITDHAQEMLGDVVYVDLRPKAGESVQAGAEVGVVESVKTASDIYSPVSGEITEVNAAVIDDPSAVNSSPYGDGWFFRIRLSKPEELEALLKADAYGNLCEEQQPGGAN